jgi:hypothetical protein
MAVTIAEALLGEDPVKWLLTFTTKASASSTNNSSHAAFNSMAAWSSGLYRRRPHVRYWG